MHITKEKQLSFPFEITSEKTQPILEFEFLGLFLLTLPPSSSKLPALTKLPLDVRLCEIPVLVTHASSRLRQLANGGEVARAHFILNIPQAVIIVATTAHKP